MAFVAACWALCGPADAAGPAVSAPNAKVEFDAGAFSLPSGTMFLERFAGTVTLPVGDAFGLQGDVSVAGGPGFTASVAVHGFTRDPQSYLIGGTLGAVLTPGATVLAAGPEAELYFDRWTLEAWGGAAITRPSSGPARLGPFVMGDVAVYPSSNFRLSAGLSLLDGFAAVHFGSEYLFDSRLGPLAVTADARIGQDGSVLATVGLRAYFGSPRKSLIARHREDDPWDRGASLFTALGSRSFATAGGSGGGSGSGSGGSGETGTTDETGGSGGTGGTVGTGGDGGSDGTEIPTGPTSCTFMEWWNPDTLVCELIPR